MNIESPTNEQELFIFAIRKAVVVHSEFGSGHGRSDELQLLQWADDYAKAHGLTMPKEMDDFGIYYIDPEDLPEMLARCPALGQYVNSPPDSA